MVRASFIHCEFYKIKQPSQTQFCDTVAFGSAATTANGTKQNLATLASFLTTQGV